jgi:hypothetical protein
MRHVNTSTGDRLVNALHALGVNFLMGGKETDETLSKHPTRLITKLAQSEEARLRLSLIPLFLEHPHCTGTRCGRATHASVLLPSGSVACPKAPKE